MAFLKSLIKEHGTKYYEPIGKAIRCRWHQESERGHARNSVGHSRCLVAIRELASEQFLGAAAKPVIPSGGPSKPARARRMGGRPVARSHAWPSMG